MKFLAWFPRILVTFIGVIGAITIVDNVTGDVIGSIEQQVDGNQKPNSGQGWRGAD